MVSEEIAALGKSDAGPPNSEVIRIASQQTAFSFFRVIRAIHGQKLLNNSRLEK